jgi:hypothetical protein
MLIAFLLLSGDRSTVQHNQNQPRITQHFALPHSKPRTGVEPVEPGSDHGKLLTEQGIILISITESRLRLNFRPVFLDPKLSGFATEIIKSKNRAEK